MITTGMKGTYFYFPNNTDFSSCSDPFYKKFGPLISSWKNVSPLGNYTNIYQNSKHEYFTMKIAMATAYQFHAYFLWHVDIGYPNRPKLRLYVDHDDIKNMFKDRNIREGKNRKEALLNWVMCHQRKKPVKNEYTTVKRHMRGSYPFVWDGLECTIIPSKEDVKKQLENIQSEKTAEIICLLEASN
jgi:hypothetical protein